MARKRGHRISAAITEEHRASIQASQIINRLTDFVNSKVSLSPAQVTAALGLLRKCVPDLAAVDHTGDIQQTVRVLQVSHPLEDAKPAINQPSVH